MEEIQTVEAQKTPWQERWKRWKTEGKLNNRLGNGFPIETDILMYSQFSLEWRDSDAIATGATVRSIDASAIQRLKRKTM